MAAIASPVPATAEISNERIEDAVQFRLKHDQYTSAADIQAAVERQQVTIRGRAPNLVVKTRAERIAETVPGVVEVHNEIRIPPAEQTDDDELQEAILERFRRDPYLGSRELDVDVRGGVATLAGRVPRRSMADAALDLASEVDGLTDVADNIQVLADIETEEGTIGQSDRNGGPITDPRVLENDDDPGNTSSDLLKSPAASRLKAGPDGDAGARSLSANPLATNAEGENSPNQLLPKVRRQVDADSRIDLRDFTFSQDDLTVRVAGTVDRLTEKRAVRDAVARVDGVQDIDVSDVRVESDRPRRDRPEQLDDQTVADYVRERLRSSNRIDASNIEVSADDRMVTLDGSVSTAGERRRAIAEARMVRDVRGVEDRLTVDSMGNMRSEATPASEPKPRNADPRGLNVNVFTPDGQKDDPEPRNDADDKIAERVKDAFGPAADAMTVRVADGIVNLDGTVPSRSMQERMIRLAEDVQGVQSVLDNLSIGGDLGTPATPYASRDPYVDGIGALDYLDSEFEGADISLAEAGAQADMIRERSGLPQEILDDLGPVDETDVDDITSTIDASRKVTTPPERAEQRSPAQVTAAKPAPLVDSVREAIARDTRINDGLIDVSVSEPGAVTLTGEVDNYVDWAAARRAAYEAGAADVTMDVSIR